MVKTKVFIGNLAFRTTESDLTREFEAAGKVSSANIITRGSRSLGYGFVEMESEEEANKAVQLLNKKNIDGRELNVEVARPRDPNAPRPVPRVRRAPRGDGQRGQGPRRGAPRGAPRREYAPRDRSDRPDRPDRSSAPKRVTGPHGLFIANLPFTVDDAKLTELFAGLNLKSAHVVSKGNRSKGYGFADFENAEDQQRALKAVDKKPIDGRELVVKAVEASGPAPNSPAAK